MWALDGGAALSFCQTREQLDAHRSSAFSVLNRFESGETVLRQWRGPIRALYFVTNRRLMRVASSMTL